MKFIHLADLHLGKKVFGYDLEEEQQDVLRQVLELADQREADGVLICGDVFDTAAPPVNAVELFDWFLSELYQRSLDVFIISGNHDSAGRLQFGSRIFSESRIHIASRWNGAVEYADLEKNGEKVRIHMLPFIKPGMVRRILNTEDKTWSEAIQSALNQASLDPEACNILLSHQYYRGAKPCESEVSNVGTLDEVDCACLEPFDYAALGHLHNPQPAGRRQNRYPGTLLKFSASELGVRKTITLIDTRAENTQGNPGEPHGETAAASSGADSGVYIEEIPVHPLRDMVRIQGLYDQVVSKDFRQTVDPENYVYIVLDDPSEQFDAFEKLRTIYPRILKVEYSSLPEEHSLDEYSAAETRSKSPEEIIREFYKQQNDSEMDDEQIVMIKQCLEEMYEAD